MHKPSKHKIFVKHLYNAGPASKTLGRRCINVIQMFCVYWDCMQHWCLIAHIQGQAHKSFMVNFQRQKWPYNGAKDVFFSFAPDMACLLNMRNQGYD